MRPEDPLLDLGVAQRKFAEAQDLYAMRDTFAGGGWEVMAPSFPSMSVYLRRDGVRRFGVRLGLRNYDFTAASLVYVDAAGAVLPYGSMRLTRYPDPRLPTGWGNRVVAEHPDTQLPFLCIEGTWEFHSHLQHRHVRWDDHRRRVSLQDVISNAFDAIDIG